MRKFAILSVITLVAAVLAACGGGGSASESGSSAGSSSSSSSSSSPSYNMPAVLKASYVPTYSCGRNFYVDPVKGKAWTAYADGGGSVTEPWKTPQDANDAQLGGSAILQAGDCVNLASGTYNLTAETTLTHGGNSNSTGGYIVYRASTPGTAHLIATGAMYGIINIQTAYIILDGLEIDGNKATATGEAVATSGSAGHHHIIVENCIIHDAGGGGVQLNDSEYFWIVNNVVYNNASTNTYQESGISIYQAQVASAFTATAADTALSYHIVIADNISHDNMETYNCGATPGCHTDGNGIIIDKTLNVDRAGGIPYTGKTLIVGNVVYGNGGGGVHLYLSEHVTVANNTVYNNHLDTQNSGTWRGELSTVDSDDITWVNNIGDAVIGTGILANNSAVLVASTGANYTSANVTWRANLTFGGTVNVSTTNGTLDPSQNLLGVDPQFVGAAAADFHLKTGSPAISAGIAETYLTPTKPNIGAF